MIENPKREFAWCCSNHLLDQNLSMNECLITNDFNPKPPVTSVYNTAVPQKNRGSSPLKSLLSWYTKGPLSLCRYFPSNHILKCMHGTNMFMMKHPMGSGPYSMIYHRNPHVLRSHREKVGCRMHYLVTVPATQLCRTRAIFVLLIIAIFLRPQ